MSRTRTGTVAVPNGRVHLTTPLTYQLRGDNSFLNDLLLVKRGDDEAVDRMRRHEKEMRDQLPMIERRGSSTQPEGVEFEYRAPDGSFPTGSTPGGGGSFTPPAWMVAMEGTYPRPQRIVADLVDPYPLPDGVSSINVPVLTTGTSTGQQTPNTPVSDTDVTDTASSSPVVQIAGQEDIPMQMLEQSPRGSWEATLLRDLWADYDAKLERQMLLGTGGQPPVGQMLGVLNVANTNSITYTDGSPTGTAMYPKFGQSFGIVSDTRKLQPEGWLMRGNRFGWLATSEDQSSRPLEVPMSAASLVMDPSKPTPVGSLVGLPVFCDEQLPSTNGTAQNQDVIIGFRWSDYLAWEGRPKISVHTQVLSGTLQARVQYRRYAAGIFGRYPSGIVTISGTGMVVPTYS